jgi:hypothetical protein
MKKLKPLPFWIACVQVRDPVEQKTHFSLLSFPAQNRFYAVQEIEQRLPENPKLRNDEGGPLPYRVVRLEQCLEQEAGRKIMDMSNTLQQMHSGTEETFFKRW